MVAFRSAKGRRSFAGRKTTMAGRTPAPRRRGKSGLRRTGWSLTATGRKARDSATESRPPKSARADQVRVKRCGKSAPAAGATRLARQTPPGARPSRTLYCRRFHAAAYTGRSGPIRRSGRLLETPGNRRPRKMAVPRARPFGRHADRTRLTGPLRDPFFLSRNLTGSGIRSPTSGFRRQVCLRLLGLACYSAMTSSPSITCSSLLMQS